MKTKMIWHVVRWAMLATMIGWLVLFAPLAMPQAHAAPKTTLGDLPPAAQSLVSASLGRDDAAYQFQATVDGYRAANVSDALRVDWSNAGMRIQSGEALWTMGLQAIGYGDALETISQVAPTANANRLEYAHDTFTEWYVNGPAGLEQGWTLTSPPPSTTLRSAQDGDGSALTLALALEGNVRLDASGNSIALLGNDGAVALNYTGLVAYDATGRNLRAWFELGDHPGSPLHIHVDDADAQYPLTIDPYVFQATLINAGEMPASRMGHTVAMSADGSTIVTTGSNGIDKGAVYVFVKSSNWVSTSWPTAVLTNSDGLGSAVTVSPDGSTIVVGSAWGDNTKGAVYVYVKSGNWVTTSTPNATLKNSAGAVHDYLGASVAISADGSTIAAGAYGLYSVKGAVNVFVKPGSWTTTSTPNAILTNSGDGDHDALGSSVAINTDGSTIVASAYGVGNFTGAVDVFVKSGSWATTSTPTAVLTHSGGAANDYFGRSVSISADGSTIVTGEDGVNTSKGAVDVFLKSGGWAADSTPNAILTNADGADYNSLGYSVAISSDGSTIVAGAPGTNNGSTEAVGAACVFVKGLSWATTTAHPPVLSNFYSIGNDQLGISVAISANGSNIVAGADGSGGHEGEVDVFVKSSSWTTTSAPTARLENSGSFALDNMGRSVAVSADGSTIVVGADGVSAGINKGAAYVFVKQGSSWATTGIPVAMLTNSSGANTEFLGHSVAISADGSIIVAGAYGINGYQGGVYVFTKSGSWATTGTPTAILTNSGGGSGDELGYSVAISGDGTIIVAGAHNANSNQGAADVFVKSSSWTTMTAPTAILTNSGGASGDHLGYSVAINSNGSTIVAGANGVSSNAGAVDVFVKPGTSWATISTPTAILYKSLFASPDQMGNSVAINSTGTTIIAGAPGASSNKGAVCVFIHPLDGWGTTSSPTAILTNSSGVSGDNLGYSVAINSDSSRIVAGAYKANTQRGAVDEFTKSGGWASTSTPSAVLMNTGDGASDQLGYSVAISADGLTIAAGGILGDGGKGAAYVFGFQYLYLPLIMK